MASLQVNSASRLRISAKFTLLFAVSVLVTTIMAGIAASNMSRLAENTTELYQEPYTISTAALRLRNYVIDFRGSLQRYVALEGGEGTQVLDARMRQLGAQFDSDLQIVTNAWHGDPAILQQLQQSASAWQRQLEAVIEQAGQPQRALEALQATEVAADLLEQFITVAIGLAEVQAKDFVDVVQQDSTRLIWLGIALSLVSLVILAGLVFVTYRSVVRPIGGEPDSIAAQVEQVANGNLAGIDGDHRGSGIAASMGRMTRQLAGIVVDLRESATVLSERAGEIALENGELARRTEKQARELETTVSSVEEFAGTVSQNAENAAHADEVVKATRSQAEETGQVMNRALQAMQAIDSASKRIADIVQVIDGLSFQTNLLALNAAVEAARAGDHGKGFAVVAMEVRNLAQRSAESAREIRELITDSVSKVNDGTLLAHESEKSLEGIIESVQTLSQIVGEIAGSSREQSLSIQLLNQTLNALDSMTQENAALVQRNASASELVDQQARQLQQKLEFFRISRQPASSRGRSVKPISPASPSQSSKTQPDANQSTKEWVSFSQ